MSPNNKKPSTAALWGFRRGFLLEKGEEPAVDKSNKNCGSKCGGNTGKTYFSLEKRTSKRDPALYRTPPAEWTLMNFDLERALCTKLKAGHEKGFEMKIMIFRFRKRK